MGRRPRRKRNTQKHDEMHTTTNTQHTAQLKKAPPQARLEGEVQPRDARVVERVEDVALVAHVLGRLLAQHEAL